MLYDVTMHVCTVMARPKNDSPDLTEDPAPILPPTFIECEQLWQGRSRRTSWRKDQWAFVRSAIEPLLYARIEPEPERYASGLLNFKGAPQAQAIKLTSVSFENGSLPIISAYAEFHLTFDRAFADTAAFYDWQEQTDWMDFALCFGFRLQDGGEWDATWEHGVIDFELITD